MTRLNVCWVCGGREGGREGGKESGRRREKGVRWGGLRSDMVSHWIPVARLEGKGTLGRCYLE